MRFMTWAGALALVAATGCATKAPEQALSIRGLTQPVPLAVQAPEGKGNFYGIERLARNSDGKIDANVLLVHGIGWTQASAVQQIGFDFIDALEAAYGVRLGSSKARIARLCSESSGTLKDASHYQVGELRLWRSAKPMRFYTDDPLSPIVSSGGCQASCRNLPGFRRRLCTAVAVGLFRPIRVPDLGGRW